MKLLTVTLSLVFVLSLNSNAQTNDIKPKGTYKTIAVERHNKAIQLL